ncbi:hypothetical protein [Vitiosangium sp. GDMCC 1.1324]|uniref:hypothetical protein n=1 Tax=Vitiosangium sp. (strain GDMCC 1.1324) TaxID=2138576 RepID=UPI000D34D694|nr:hypothetical protein [Vitiosangium sp. GDMCC 1.1324]PTL79808.1 hypothetical protein DAT35_30675 [Vitiosangium sp. GDMCC 1.1324]
MKVLKFYGSRDEDYLRLSFDGAFSPQATLESEFAPFLQALEEHAGEWMPDVVEGKRRRKCSRAAIWKSLEEERDEDSTTIGLYRTKWPALDMTLGLWFPPLHPKLRISIKVKPLSFFAETQRCRHFVEMVRAWASRYPVTHVKAHSIDDMMLAGSPNFGRDDETLFRDGFDKIYEVFWLNVFGPKLVETVGRERMLSTPAHRVEEFPNGSVLLVTWPTVADFASEEARLAQARAYAHLRPDLDFDTVLRTLRERSATLAPVEPRFHPDVAPLLSRVVDRVASHERQRRIAEFNAWQPPEPEEWRPADSALPSDDDDPKGALKLYDTLAEHLVALLHTKAPSVFEATPESLTDADFYFWREEFPTSRLPEAINDYAVPAIGAYLGEVLVRNLGGKWIPRKNLMEAQVLVGNRVWFPFVRAQRYMRSRQSLLDYSLTRLYRVAERHRD